jgi:hypothetical protein
MAEVEQAAAGSMTEVESALPTPQPEEDDDDDDEVEAMLQENSE